MRSFKFWCLIYGEEMPIPFSVEADLEWDVNDLTKATQQRRHVLRDSDIIDIVLWKLNEPIPVDPKDTFLERLPKSITDSSVELERYTQKLSDAFPGPPEGHLHILVTLRGQRRSKKPRLDSPEPEVSERDLAERNLRRSKRPRLDSPKPEVSERDLAEWNLLWNTFWGKQATECFIKASTRIPDPRTLETTAEETNYEYLKLPNDDDLFPCDLTQILITETYKSLYAKLCEQDELYSKMLQSQRLTSLTHSTVITGQPGTGKTVSLSCILVWRLQERKQTVYCNNKTHAFVFTNTGVQRVPLRDGKRIEALDRSTHCCALVDVNTDLLEIPSQFHPSRRRQGRVVVATSPNPKHVIAFKQNRGETYYTPTWKWADLYCASSLQFPSFDPKTLRNVYTKLGGIPWRCFLAISSGEDHEMRIIKDAIDKITNIVQFSRSANKPMPFNDNTSHVLIRVEPIDDTWKDHITHLLSTHVAELVYDRFSICHTISIRDSIDFLLRNPNARSWGGKLFERAVHRAFRKGIEFEPVAVDDDAPSLRVKIKETKCEATGYFHKLSVGARKGSQDVADEYLNQYLIPLSSTAETVDAVYISEDVTVFFQMTVSSSHSLELKGITELTNELPAAAKKRICIVFIVPNHDTTCKSYKRQKIVIPHGISRDVSDPVVAYKQYVHYFPMDQL